MEGVNYKKWETKVFVELLESRSAYEWVIIFFSVIIKCSISTKTGTEDTWTNTYLSRVAAMNGHFNFCFYLLLIQTTLYICDMQNHWYYSIYKNRKSLDISCCRCVFVWMCVFTSFKNRKCVNSKLFKQFNFDII